MRRPKPAKQHKTTTPNSFLRIIAGQWRGRKLEFIPHDGLRPTPDRIRETLFNWLQPHIAGARCLDLFAGSGTLGLEALSRGADALIAVEQGASACSQLEKNLQLLNCQAARVQQTDVLQWLSVATEAAPYNLVFLDPPFRKAMVEPCCQLLETHHLLADNALIYIETEAELAHLRVPENWLEHRHKTSGQVSYRLFLREERSATG